MIALATSCSGSGPDGPHDVICPLYDPALLPATAGTHVVPTESAGTIDGKFSVSRTGDAAYTMPLVVPPGRAGMQPALAIVYDSSQGEALLGVGFSLSGLSSITRCPQNLAQDGRVRGVRYDESDKLCLDGLRLVQVQSSQGPLLGRVDEFRTFPDTFQRVLAHYPLGWDQTKGPQFFEVYTKAGRVLEYGNAKSGRVLGEHGLVRDWWVTREADRRDNAILYHYRNEVDPHDGHTVTHAPLRIDYTDHPAAPASRAIRFETITWSAHAAAYTGGMRTSRATRVDRIVMLGPGDAPVRTYVLHYGASPATGRARLTSVAECAGDGSGVCKPPTRFGWLDTTPGFTQKITTSIPHPSYDHDPSYAWIATDLDGDGLDDLAVARADATGGHEEWLTALSKGTSFGPLQLGTTTGLPWKAQQPGMYNPGALGHFNLVPHPYDLEGHNGLLFNDLAGGGAGWMLRADDGSLHIEGTAVVLPQRVGSEAVTSSGVLYADMDGDGVPDLIECAEPYPMDLPPDQTKGLWTLRRWGIGGDGVTPGFQPPEPIDAMDQRNCLLLRDIRALDVDGDGKTELLVPPLGYPLAEGTYGIECAAPCTYQALAWDAKGWTSTETHLPAPAWVDHDHGQHGVVYFADLNADGLPDAVETGFADKAPRTFVNTGRGFAPPVVSLSAASATGGYFTRATMLDYDGDGQTDLLLPMDGHCSDPSAQRPCLVVWRSNPAGDGTFTLIDTGVPTMNPPSALWRSWLAPQIGDVNGDGRADVILPLDGHYTVLVSNGPGDLLTSIADGLNPLDPGDQGFTPNISIAYGTLLDHAKTAGLADDDPAREGETYLPRSDDDNGCTYPRVCVVGTQRVVRTYQTNDGQNHVRTFTVRYREGRYDRLLGSFLGFGTRIVTDLDALSGSLERYDNVTYNDQLATYPYAGSPAHVWTWSPALPATPGPIELSYTDTTHQTVPTQGGTFFVLPQRVHALREQGTYPVPGSSATVLQYVTATAQSPATSLRDSTSEVLLHDLFGNVLLRFDHTEGIDDKRWLTRSVENDEEHWLLGLVQSDIACSDTSTTSACRTTTRTYNDRGEVDVETRGDPSDPETQLTTTYTRDAFGNLVRTAADDAFGHHRAACMRFEAEGIFPFAVGNPAHHITLFGFDPALGAKVSEVDPNGLATTWRYDTFGRVAWENRPDGTSTQVTLARTKNGGPQHNWWRTQTTIAADGGAVTTTETDALGRTVRVETRGPEVPACSEAQCTPAPTFVQDTAYDTFGRVVRHTLPHLKGDPLSSIHADEYRYDAIGRVVHHTSPWGAVTAMTYDGSTVFVDEPGSVHASTTYDPLDRVVTVIDGKGGSTSYTYGPFGASRSVITPDGLVTSIERDAYGRVRRQNDPDRGVTIAHYDGFGERSSAKDALGREIAFTYDVLGRLVQRDDPDGSTRWAYDTAPHGIGALASVTSPAGAVESRTYDTRGRLATTTLSLDGENFTTSFTYDAKSRLFEIVYPSGAGAPFTVRHAYDTFGHLLMVQGDTTVYWRLGTVDGAGRTTLETFGNNLRTHRGYYADRGTLRSIVTTRPDQSKLQDLLYTYDDRNNLWTRSDGLQPSKIEQFGHDHLDRLTCATLIGGPTCAPGQKDCPCDLVVHYAPNGNIQHKSDRGAYAYDPAHPHAVASAGDDGYAYDDVGNQVERPDAKIDYTAFDLPKRYTLAADGSTIDLAYDGEQQRIRKTTATTDTIYVGGLYERVTHADDHAVEHRYYVSAGERVVAVVSRTAKQPKGTTLYLHVDHLGSTDVLSGDLGAEVERRSYDAFGARRSPQWGQTAPVSSTDQTILGFTGQEDDELGLVNLGGRIYDPRLGRFLQTDPLVGNPLNGQSWNPYSYVLNNPLRHTDSTGMSPDDEGSGSAPPLGSAPGAEPGPNDSQVAQNRNGERYDWQKVKEAAKKGGATVTLTDGNQITLIAAETTVVGTALPTEPAPVSAPPPLLCAVTPAAPLGAPGAPTPPAAPPGAFPEAPLGAPGLGNNGWNYIEPPPVRGPPIGDPPVGPRLPVRAPLRLTLSVVADGALVILEFGMIFSGDAPETTIGPDGIPTNKKGQPYPNVIDPRTGQSVPFPKAPLRVIPEEARTPRDPAIREWYKQEWRRRGFEEPEGGWDNHHLHHIKPLRYGGGNDFDNLVPLPPEVHKNFTRYWNAY